MLLTGYGFQNSNAVAAPNMASATTNTPPRSPAQAAITEHSTTMAAPTFAYRHSQFQTLTFVNFRTPSCEPPALPLSSTTLLSSPAITLIPTIHPPCFLSAIRPRCHAVPCQVPSLPRLPMNRCLRLKMTDLQLSVDVYRGRLRLAVIAYSI